MKIVFFQNELREVEEKFRQAMVANAGLDNEKSSLTYQVIFNLSLKIGLFCWLNSDWNLIQGGICKF